MGKASVKRYVLRVGETLMWEGSEFQRDVLTPKCCVLMLLHYVIVVVCVLVC